MVLWEILTYGEVPYRGQPEANDCDHLSYYLRSGNRLVAPPNTSDELLVLYILSGIILIKSLCALCLIRVIG